MFGSLMVHVTEAKGLDVVVSRVCLALASGTGCLDQRQVAASTEAPEYRNCCAREVEVVLLSDRSTKNDIPGNGARTKRKGLLVRRSRRALVRSGPIAP